eukprot:TRINITY_DN4126_c0_g2_i3.p1 TRINITY_DN4126_c0_g2~~TRINITY_DN4126_c0_g2_i3.p1  ORF type:complete len:182 (-),score=34.16 TRINITY_DN4126_c0_g2_i3:37-582(-)
MFTLRRALHSTCATCRFFDSSKLAKIFPKLVKSINASILNNTPMIQLFPPPGFTVAKEGELNIRLEKRSEDVVVEVKFQVLDEHFLREGEIDKVIKSREEIKKVIDFAVIVKRIENGKELILDCQGVIGAANHIRIKRVFTPGSVYAGPKLKDKKMLELAIKEYLKAVSYTHLTLPTICSV